MYIHSSCVELFMFVVQLFPAFAAWNADAFEKDLKCFFFPILILFLDKLSEGIPMYEWYWPPIHHSFVKDFFYADLNMKIFKNEIW